MALVTVIVSSSAPTSSFRSSVRRSPIRTSMPCRATFLKPGSSAVTVYVPGVRIQEVVGAVGVGRRRGGLIGVGVRGGHRGPREDRAGAIGDAAGNGAAELLRHGRNREQHGQRRKHANTSSRAGAPSHVILLAVKVVQFLKRYSAPFF